MSPRELDELEEEFLQDEEIDFDEVAKRDQLVVEELGECL